MCNICVSVRRFLTKRDLGMLSSLGLKEDIYLEAKTESTGQFPPSNDKQDMSLEIMAIVFFSLRGIPSLKIE